MAVDVKKADPSRKQSFLGKLGGIVTGVATGGLAGGLGAATGTTDALKEIGLLSDKDKEAAKKRRMMKVG